MNRFIEWFLPEWANSHCADPSHSHGRRYTESYKKKQEVVKSVWIGSGLVMLAFPVLPFVAALGLLTTFLAFVILDETP